MKARPGAGPMMSGDGGVNGVEAGDRGTLLGGGGGGLRRRWKHVFRRGSVAMLCGGLV